MNIDLTAEQEAWLATRVGTGEGGSVEGVLIRVLNDRMAETPVLDELEWTIPHLEQARAAAARGESMAIEEYKARLARLNAEIPV